MRTTVVLPPELMRAAKARAAERGETLTALLKRAVQNELGRAGVGRPASWPLLKTRYKQARRLSNADIEEIFAAEDSKKAAGRR
jgi:hypothetical protein